MKSFWGNTEAKTWTEHTTLNTALGVEEEPVRSNPITLKKFLQAQKKDEFCQKCAESVGSSIMLPLRPVRDTSSKIQTGRDPAESRTERTSSSASTPGSLSDNAGSLGRNSDVLYSGERALLVVDGRRRTLDRTKLSELYPALSSTLLASKAGEVHFRNLTP